MFLRSITYEILFLLMVGFPFSLLAEENEHSTIAGIYKSKVDGNSLTILYLNVDHTATIECMLWYSERSTERRVNTYPAEWAVNGTAVTVTYNGIVQQLTYHPQLSLKEYGIRDATVPGLTTSEDNTEDGLLAPIILWHRDALQQRFREGNIITRMDTGKWHMTAMSMGLVVAGIAALVGRKKPLFGGLSGAIVAPSLYVVFSPVNAVGVLLCVLGGFFVGIVAGGLSALLVSSLKGKGHNIGPSYMSGFGGGRGGAPPGGIILSDEERKHLKKR